MENLHSFYLETKKWTPPIVLDGSEAHHLLHVLRLKQGQAIELFDGAGQCGTFLINGTGKDSVQLTVLSKVKIPPPPVRCTLAAAFSKALRRGWFLEKAVELEAAAVWFWQGEHSHARLPNCEKSNWRNNLIAGAKQSKNPWLPELRTVQGGAKELAAAIQNFNKTFLLYEGDTQGRILRQTDLADPGNILLIIGPEGGFSLNEVNILKTAGAQPISLGKRVLRWETAAIVTLGLAWWARQ